MGEREELAERLEAIGRTLVAVGSFDDAADCEAAARLLRQPLASDAALTASRASEKELAEALGNAGCPLDPSQNVGDCHTGHEGRCDACHALAAYRKRQG